MMSGELSRAAIRVPISWVAAALAMFGCAQWETAEAVASGGGGAAAADLCAGQMPASVPSPVDLVLCGANGSSAAFAFGDGHGDLALGCASGDTGPGVFFGLYLAYGYGYLSKAPLGYAAWPSADGFVGMSVYPNGPFELHARDGGMLASLPGTHVLAGPRSLLVATVGAAGISVQAFSGAPQVVAAAPAGVSVGGAGDANGDTLLLWQTYGDNTAWARWLGPDGAPVTDAFKVAPWAQASIRDPLPLAGGGMAMQKFADPRWRGVIASLATAESAPPSWLSSRGGFFLARHGTAMAFTTGELLAADGTSCGSLGLGAPLVGVGLDGTAVTAPDSKTFRMWPQLLH